MSWYSLRQYLGGKGCGGQGRLAFEDQDVQVVGGDVATEAPATYTSVFGGQESQYFGGKGSGGGQGTQGGKSCGGKGHFARDCEQ